MYTFTPRGTCSTKIRFDLRDGKVYDTAFEDGCNGNLQALSRLVEGRDAEDVIRKLKGIDCDRRGTSCADQFARALEKETGRKRT